jgi:hypothetical protein
MANYGVEALRRLCLRLRSHVSKYLLAMDRLGLVLMPRRPWSSVRDLQGRHSPDSGGVAYLFIMGFPLFSPFDSCVQGPFFSFSFFSFCEDTLVLSRLTQSRWLQLHLRSMTMPRLAVNLLASLHLMNLQRQTLLQQKP